jgi:hypothetical protein
LSSAALARTSRLERAMRSSNKAIALPARLRARAGSPVRSAISARAASASQSPASESASAGPSTSPARPGWSTARYSWDDGEGDQGLVGLGPGLGLGRGEPPGGLVGETDVTGVHAAVEGHQEAAVGQRALDGADHGGAHLSRRHRAEAEVGLGGRWHATGEVGQARAGGGYGGGVPGGDGGSEHGHRLVDQAGPHDQILGRQRVGHRSQMAIEIAQGEDDRSQWELGAVQLGQLLGRERRLAIGP